jgi:hypothetical protein
MTPVTSAPISTIASSAARSTKPRRDNYRFPFRIAIEIVAESAIRRGRSPDQIGLAPSLLAVMSTLASAIGDASGLSRCPVTSK